MKRPTSVPFPGGKHPNTRRVREGIEATTYLPRRPSHGFKTGPEREHPWSGRPRGGSEVLRLPKQSADASPSSLGDVAERAGHVGRAREAVGRGTEHHDTPHGPCVVRSRGKRLCRAGVRAVSGERRRPHPPKWRCKRSIDELRPSASAERVSEFVGDRRVANGGQKTAPVAREREVVGAASIYAAPGSARRSRASAKWWAPPRSTPSRGPRAGRAQARSGGHLAAGVAAESTAAVSREAVAPSCDS